MVLFLLEMQVNELLIKSDHYLSSEMHHLLLIGALCAVLGSTLGGDYTVTDEAWFDVEVKDMDGPRQHYKGRFVLALFGETAPMTVLNFLSLTRGYTRGNVSDSEVYLRKIEKH